MYLQKADSERTHAGRNRFAGSKVCACGLQLAATHHYDAVSKDVSLILHKYGTMRHQRICYIMVPIYLELLGYITIEVMLICGSG